MFSAPTKNKTTLFTMFSYPRSPKIEPKHWYLRCFCNTLKSTRSKSTAICDTLARQHVRMLYFTVFLNRLLKNTGIYSVFWKHMHKTVNSDEFKVCIFHRKKLKEAKTPIFTAFLRNDFFKNMLFLANFWLLKPPKTKKVGYPPTPLEHLKF